jgi:hypothetical protein
MKTFYFYLHKDFLTSLMRLFLALALNLIFIIFVNMNFKKTFDQLKYNFIDNFISFFRISVSFHKSFITFNDRNFRGIYLENFINWYKLYYQKMKNFSSLRNFFSYFHNFDLLLQGFILNLDFYFII